MKAVQSSADDRSAWAWLHATASGRYRACGQFAWHFARGKLGHDPVFREALRQGWWTVDGRAPQRVLDIGSGQSLVASLLDAARQAYRDGHWCRDWPEPPVQVAYTGIELMAHDVARARGALSALRPPPTLVCGDMCEAPFPAADLVVILDVMHYVGHEAQNLVLTRVRDALRAGEDGPARRGRLLLRVADQSQPTAFAVTQWVDRMVLRARGHGTTRTWGRPVADWIRLLTALGFDVEPHPMSQGTPFANVLLLAHLCADTP